MTIMLLEFIERPCQMGLDDSVMLEQFRAIALPHIQEKVVYNTQQRVGVGFDGDVGNFRIEMKDDKTSAKTPNAFVEIKQTFDNKATWVSSGLLLSIVQADLFVMALYGDRTDTSAGKSWFVWGPPKHWQRVCLSCGTLTDTRPGANGNLPGRYARGYLVRKTDLIPASEL